MTFKFFTPFESMTYSEMTEVGRFLEKNLDEYHAPYDNIIKAIQSAIKQRPSFGGFIITACKDHQTIGAIVINTTGMDGYAPQNIIVYLAVHKDHRRKGIGQELLKQAIETAKGDIAIHLAPDHKMLGLYEKLGFQQAAIELRLSTDKDANNSRNQYSLHRSN